MGLNINEAKTELENWLAHPNELGKKPSKVMFTKRFQDKDGIECLIFKYKESVLGAWKLGIVSDSGTFSEMQEYHEETEIKDATAILEMLKNYWKLMAENYK